MEILDRVIESALDISDFETEIFYDAIFPGHYKKRRYPVCTLCIDTQKGGRSGFASAVGFDSLYKFPLIKAFETYQKNSPGKSISDSFRNFDYDKLVYVFVSGSGESKIPIINVKKNLIPEYGFGSKKLGYEKKRIDDIRKPVLNGITTTPDSTLGSFVLENGGNLVLIDGRKSETNDKKGSAYLVDGIMEDRFELALNIFTGAVSKGIINSIDPYDFVEYYHELMDETINIKNDIEKARKSEGYKKIVSYISDYKKKIIFCAQGISGITAEFANNRIGHVCELANQLSEEYGRGTSLKRNDLSWGSSPIRQDNNTLVIVISESGKGNVPDFFEYAQKAESECVFITKEGKTKYGEVIVIPDAFYLGVNMLTTAACVDASYKLDKMGIEISKKAFDRVHVKDKIYQ